MAGPRRNYIQRTTGKKVSGVTTQLGVIAKPALLWWAYGQGLFNYEALSERIALILNDQFDCGKRDKLEVILDNITNFSVLGLYEKRDEAANAGTLGHAFVEHHLRGLPDPDTKGLPKAVIDKAEGCFLTFLDWEAGRQLEVIGSEIQVVSEKTPTGGTIDHLIKTTLTQNIKNAVEILDLKTGKDIYFEAKVQVAKYGKVWEELNPGRPVKGYHILRVGPDGQFTHKFFPNLEGYDLIYEHCSEIFYLIRKLGERL